MSVQTIGNALRCARKPYHCGLCNKRIEKGEQHHVQTNVYDGRIYTWRDCTHCTRDGVLGLVHDWTGGFYDEGVTYEQASEWAEDAAWFWPRQYSRNAIGKPISASERTAARAWMARSAGGEGE